MVLFKDFLDLVMDDAHISIHLGGCCMYNGLLKELPFSYVRDYGNTVVDYFEIEKDNDDDINIAIIVGFRED